MRQRAFGARLEPPEASDDCESLAVSTFTTLQASSRARHDAWLAQGWPSVTRLCEFMPDADFSAFSKTISLEAFGLTLGRFGTQRVHRSSGLIRTAPSDSLFITIPLDVPLHTQNGMAAPGSIIFIDLSQEWQHHAPQGSMITFPIPRFIALEQCVDPRDVHGVIIHPAAASLVRDRVLSVVNDAATVPRAHACVLANTIAQLLAVALAQVCHSVRPTEAAKTMALRHRAENLVRSSLIGDRVSVASLAAQLGVSRSRLYRVFADVDGIDKAILRERLYAAAEDVLHTSEPIGKIAERYSFETYSHFSRAFLAEIGMRPAEWRKRARTES